MDFKDLWDAASNTFGGAAAFSVALACFACWTLWKRNSKLTDQMFEMAKDSVRVSEAFRSSAAEQAKASEGTAAALRDLSLRIAGWGGRGAA